MSLDSRLRRVFADVFGIDPDAVGPDASTSTIAAWDSVAHLNLVLALEGEFDVQFLAEEIAELVSFRAISDRLAEAEHSLG
jgi:acyl carrier protein